MVEIVGHRGAGHLEPENTSISFKKAIEIGCDRVELDVRVTKDNHLVVIHDKTVDRISDGVGEVSSYSLQELQELHLAQRQKISTLQEIVDVCKGRIDLQIELKGTNTAKLTNECIVKNEFAPYVRVTSFHLDRIVQIKRLNPSLIVGFLFREITEDIFKIAEEQRIEYLCPHSQIVTEEFVREAHERGHKVYAWHVPDKELGDLLISMGVDSIGTDFPELFVKNT